ncbi:TetR/AcrR family transcriptional regulator [Novosphingobium sp. LASN5T]|uniref:TetR/AcrR family transcriptional regulator n=1 Tax=Novosphingobium sp. LASN5T TaxID=2491021 RepID=UPI000F602CC3|nr:TetR family transcriptional regulator [Novosphingobium sp. LASN5T]RQW40049.1 TetR/AcrR family transcriptional regulator [Novosphingobium sp. LASN5T]
MARIAPQPLAKAGIPASHGAKVALILAGELLIARNGIEGASLREIAAQAGQRNHHAVQYHFGSRESLVQAIFDYRMDQMEATRGAMLKAAEAAGRLSDLRTIADIIYRPQIELIDQFGDYSYAGFLSAYLLRYQGSRFGQFGDRVAPNLARTLGLLRACLADLPEAVAQRRLVTASFMFLNILVIHTRDESDDGERFEDAVEDTLGQIVAALSAPFSSAQT